MSLSPRMHQPSYYGRNSGDFMIHSQKRANLRNKCLINKRTLCTYSTITQHAPLVIHLNTGLRVNAAASATYKFIQKSLINFFFSSISLIIRTFNKVITIFSDLGPQILPKWFWFIKVTPKINNFFASVIRRQITIIKETHLANLTYAKLLTNNLEKAYQFFFNDKITASQPEQIDFRHRFNSLLLKLPRNKMTQIFKNNQKVAFKRNQSYRNFPIRYNSLLLEQGFEKPRMHVLARIYKKHGYTYIGNKFTVTAVRLSNIERIYNAYGVFKQIDMQKFKNKRKHRKVRYLVKKAATYKPWFSKPVWKQILKRFKYNREAIFTHYRIRHLMKNNMAYYYAYTRGIIQQTKKLFITYKDHIINTSLPNIILLNRENADSLTSYIDHFFYLTNKLLEKVTEYPLLNFVKKTMVKLKSYINIIQLKRRYNLHFHKKKRHNARLQYIPKTDVRIWTSAGKLGFHSNKRTTPFAAEAIGKYIAQRLKKRHIHLINLEFSQPFIKKIRSFYKGIKRAQMHILRIYYKRKIMFGHIRQPKQRRV